MSKFFTIGCDPEIFLADHEDKIKSVIGLLGGDKWHPVKLTEVGHAVLEDNVAVEFNIPPCSSFADFLREVKHTMQLVKERLPKNLHYLPDSALSFPDSELNCEAAWVFGCDPDYNAWTMAENPKPHAEDKNLRSAGGHIHVGSSIAVDAPIDVVRAMDVFLGVPSTQLDSLGAKRRSLYGGPGAFRFKPYGVEYRTLSNFWIFDDKHIEWAYVGTQKALDFVDSGKKVPQEHGDYVHAAIMNNDMAAYNFLKTYYNF